MHAEVGLEDLFCCLNRLGDWSNKGTTHARTEKGEQKLAVVQVLDEVAHVDLLLAEVAVEPLHEELVGGVSLFLFFFFFFGSAPA